MYPITRSTSFVVARARLAVAVALCASGIAHVAQAETSPAPAVGQVSLVLGRAFIESPDGSRQPLTSGAQVHSRDQIFTETNGHVHIRFVDDALVSVRPGSRLEIVQYDYNPEQPQLSAIKLNLQEGVARSISGRGASSARERFRLNTPIAAIGVRGTDFVVSASERAVRAQVNEGAIVLAPFSSGCAADAFGPCAENAIELTGTALQMIEFDSSSSAPRLLAAGTEAGSSPRLTASADDNVVASAGADVVRSEGKSVVTGTDAYVESVASSRVENNAGGVLRPPVTPPAPTPSLTDKQLLWGRFADTENSLASISMDYAEARQSRDVTVRVGDYILFREGNGSERVQSGLGPVSFALANAQAVYDSGSGVVAMTVNSGDLAINFDTNTFATHLDLSHGLTGKVDFTASGLLRDGGYFHSRSETERLAGAVSLDGAEAGYYFEKQLQAGAIQGLTLWDKR